MMYWNDHAPAHFHTLYAEHRAVIEIDAMTVIGGSLPKSGLGVGSLPPRSIAGRVEQYADRLAAREDRMKKLPRITLAEPVIHGVLKVVFTDGYEGVVDIRPIIARGRIFTWLQKPKNFKKVQLEEYGTTYFGSMTKAKRSISALTRSGATLRSKQSFTN
jgi:hypothetical protein